MKLKTKYYRYSCWHRLPWVYGRFRNHQLGPEQIVGGKSTEYFPRYGLQNNECDQ